MRGTRKVYHEWVYPFRVPYGFFERHNGDTGRVFYIPIKCSFRVVPRIPQLDNRCHGAGTRVQSVRKQLVCLFFAISTTTVTLSFGRGTW